MKSRYTPKQIAFALRQTESGTLVLDHFSRESLSKLVEGNIGGWVDVLAQPGPSEEKPQTIVLDNGPGFTFSALEPMG